MESRTEPIGRPRAKPVVWLLWSVKALLAGLALFFFFLNRGTPVPAYWGTTAGPRNGTLVLLSQLQSILATVLLPSLFGPLIVSHRPGHPIGWLLYLVRLFFAASSPGKS